MPTAGTGPFWSVIVPKADSNRVTNPSFEYGTAGWTGQTGVRLGTTSGTSTFGAWSVAVNGTTTAGTLRVGSGLQSGGIVLAAGSYNSSAYVWNPPGGRVALIAGSFNAGTYGTAYGSAVGWQRLNVGWGFSAISTVQLQVVADVTNMGTIYVDGVQIESGTIASTYIDGEQPGCTWDGLPHASRSSRSGDTRLGGQVVRFDDIGFTVDTSPGIGAPPFNTLSQSYAQLDGGEFQRQRKAERRFQLTSLVSGTSWADLHYQRRRLIEAIRIENTPTQQPMRLLYSGAGGTLAIDAVWDGGVQFDADGQSFSEGIVASFTAYDPDWKDTLQDGTTLGDYRELTNQKNIIYRDSMGYWDSIVSTTLNAAPAPQVMISSLDGGTLYAANFDTIPVLMDGITSVPNRIMWYAAGSWGTIGNGTISGRVYDMKWDIDGSRLLIAGSLGTVGGTAAGQLAFWNPSTNQYGTTGFHGTGTALYLGGYTDPEIRSILPWAPGTYYLGGFMHRINNTLLGSNWNIIRWDGAVGGWSAVAPVSVTGTGFIWRDLYFNTGSYPGVVYNLTKINQNQMLVSANANILRGFGGSISTATYDVRGTWGTIPGYRVPQTNLNYASDAYKAPNQVVYQAYYGTSTLGTAVLKLQGLTAAGLGTVDTSYAMAIEPDEDTVAWIAGDGFSINNNPFDFQLIRTNGYDYQPGDYFSDIATPYSLYKSPNGTLYFGIGYGINVNGTAASLGTIVNRGMSNVYPTLRVRNTSTTGTANLFQWANMNTKEYAWFSLRMLAGEIVTLTTGPGRVAFQSNYRGDILGNIVGGSKLASWHLVPGQNIVSFLSDNSSVVVDMYWNPRYHSADGTGIV